MFFNRFVKGKYTYREFTNITPVSNGTTNTGDAFKMMADIKYKTIDANGIVDMKYAPVIIEADFKLSLCKTFTRPTSVNPK